MFVENISDVYLHPSLSIPAGAILSALEYTGDIPLEVTSEGMILKFYIRLFIKVSLGKLSSFISIYRRDPPVDVWEYINHLSSSPVQSAHFRRRILNSWQISQQKLDWNDVRIQSSTIENLIRIDTFQSVKMILISEHVRQV